MLCVGPHHAQSISSRSITEVKQRRAGLVLGNTWCSINFFLDYFSQSTSKIIIK